MKCLKDGYSKNISKSKLVSVLKEKAVITYFLDIDAYRQLTGEFATKSSILKMSSTSHAKEKFRIEGNFPLSRHWSQFIKLICKPLAAYIGMNILSGKKSLEV